MIKLLFMMLSMGIVLWLGMEGIAWLSNIAGKWGAFVGIVLMVMAAKEVLEFAL
jgi:hypothetical protein